MEYIYSQLKSDSVLQFIKSHYKLPISLSCKYYVLGLHDNYLIESENKRYIFRIYRNDWRTEEEILFEIDLLSYLDKKSVNVVAPILTRNSKLITYIESPEGIRVGVLFNYADGYAPTNSISPEVCKLLGASVANIHEKTNKFKTKYFRQILDISYLVDQSLVQIKPFLNTNQFEYLQKIQSKIYSNVSHINSDNSNYGICVGDINASNFHINEKNIITHFDFDQCGYGYRAFELGKFSSSLRNDDLKKDNVLAFLEGYEKIGQLNDIEKLAIPYFEIVSIIWVMSIHVSNADRIGYKYLEKEFWTQRIGKIEVLAATLI